MKPYVPRLIAYCIAVFMAIIHLLGNFSSENLILTAVLLGILALAVFAGHKKTMASTAPAFVVAWIYFGILAPITGLDADTFSYGVDYLLASIGEAPGMLIVFLIGFLAAQIFLRKSDTIFFILIRYVVMGGFFLCWCSAFDGAQPLIPLLLLNVALNLSHELQTRRNGARQGRTVSCMLTGLCCIFIYCLAGDSGVSAVTALLTLRTGSLYTILGITLLGAMMLLEEKSKGNAGNDPFKGLGGMLIYWSVTALIMLVWQETANMALMMVAPLILFYAYKAFAKSWSAIPGRSMTSALYHIIWCLSYLGVLVIAKCISMSNVLATIFLIMAPVAAAVCWHIARKNNKETQIMVSYVGVAAVLLLSFTKNVDPSNVADVILLLLTAGGLGVFWCLLSGRIISLNSTASTVDKAEFSIVKAIHVYVPLAVLGAAVIKILAA